MNDQLDLTAAMSGPHITIHSDGAAKGNPGPGGWGAVLCRMDGTTEVRRKICQGFDPTMTVTNIRMEMTAVAAALEAIKSGEPQPIIVRPDLIIIVKGMTEWLPRWIANGWRKSDGSPIENQDLWQRIIAATQGKTVFWLHVKGHAGDERNERADRLANDQMHKAVAAAFAQAA